MLRLILVLVALLVVCLPTVNATYDSCAYYYSCASCSYASSTYNCGWCVSSGVCTNNNATLGGTVCPASPAGNYIQPVTSTQCSALPESADYCNTYGGLGCSSCSSYSGCGWCQLSSTSSLGMCVPGATPSTGPYNTSITCGGGWTLASSSGSSSSCPAVSTSCSSHYSCGSCNAAAGCGWCSTSSSNTYSGTCVPGGTNGPTYGTCSAFGYYWAYQTCRTPTQGSCSQFSSCDTCEANSNCGWCTDGSGNDVGCSEGYSSQPFNSNQCPTANGYSWSQYYCPSSGGGSSGGGSSSSQNIAPVLTDESYNSKGKAAFPLFFIVLFSTIAGLIIYASNMLKPVAGSKVGQPSSFGSLIGPSGDWIMISMQFVSFVLLLAAAADDSYSDMTGYGVTYNFGVVGYRASGFGNSVHGYYTCSPSGGTSGWTTQDKIFCASFLLGGVFQLIYEVFGLCMMCIAGLYAVQFKRTGGMIAPRVWQATGLSFVISISLIFNWALTVHLCILNMYNSSSIPLTPHLSASWGLIFPVFVMQGILTWYWSVKIERTAPGSVLPPGTMVASPVMFPATAVVMQPGQPYPQQPMYAPQVQPVVYAAGAQPPPPGQYIAPPQQGYPQQQPPMQQGYPAQPYPQQGPPMQQGYPAQPGYPQQQQQPPQYPAQPYVAADPSAPPQGYVNPAPVANSQGFTQI